ncbi:MAG: hypothetical protein EOQ39_07150 [Mesorhizobium sp.]|uniref:hypothetical protein n=1 Tax=Mesorhizobium sp. TaxID=1871066 RepID=UPI000FE8EADE|nr:hypothetical protein [Mesorhizobium sp.]RWB02887.1 MAG: hypothetical protein EOQ37_20770 [Mesorhizobium sp.]RWB17141.1 MAG: hypothetical protein EOQ39_07150 [Mesorhizobium sp.]
MSAWLHPKNAVKRLFGHDENRARSVVEIEEAPPKATWSPAVSTSNLKEYLDYYRSRVEPHYAVLVTGDWGTGKTYQVRQAIPAEEAYYVSLFGLNSTDDVVAAVYTAMFPRKAWVKKIADGVGEMTAEVSGFGSLAVGGLTSGLVGAFLRQEVNNDRPIIFDDLERCGLGVKETLGIINLYVEHHGCRVIVIAHDQKLAEEFSEAKEKIFGQTIRVEPQIIAAFDDFHSTLPTGPEKNFVSAQRDNIIGVFSESGAKSLRILRHVIEDLNRLIGVLSQEHLANDQAMVELVRLFCAFDVEWRAGRLEPEDLSQRRASEFGYIAGRGGKEGAGEQPKIVVAKNRYSSVNLTSLLLQDEVLGQMLIEGRFDSPGVRASLDASSYFLKPQSAAPWQIVGSFDKLDDEVVNEALKKMQEQFNERTVVDSGEMLHIFALRMMMASKGILGKDIKTVATECRSYVDSLLAEGRLPQRGSDWRWYDEFERSAYGVGYWVADDYKAEFEAIFRHLLDARGKALEAKFPELAPDLLKIVEVDGQRFLEEVCYTGKGTNRYASIPILAAIAPKDFIAAWMRSPKANWYWISNALQERHKGARSEEILKPEAGWIDEVARLLGEEADKASGLAKLRLQRAIPKLPPRQVEPSAISDETTGGSREREKAAPAKTRAARRRKANA